VLTALLLKPTAPVGSALRKKGNDLMTNRILPLCVAGLLAACGGSGGGGSGGASNDNAFAFNSYSQGAKFGDALGTKLLARSPTPAAGVPVTGTARYDGIIDLSLQNQSRDTVIGTVRLDVDFATNSFDGSAGYFMNPFNERVSGSLQVTNGTIVRQSVPFVTADLTGSVVFDAGRMNVTANAAGSFAGTDADLNAVKITGTGKLTSGNATRNIIGAWTAERQ
jgi:hypothetical protein